ncbi:hypothetical protein CXB49_13015 [Chromobacterium sp. ATCC 53434]|uniref:Ig-like domain-containing protein n=1 Tax=Chromobacterium TaxID=535 RepID=UPI000C7944F1|nr:Ig-like domain-containing protein [Chromobacterium sp. ATCC 53434]AUH51669.1 hypothetical protein CXB49_13015 [Chromobacterium sp. ATCC 53434]
MANSLSVVGVGDVYEFDAGGPSRLQIKVTDLTNGKGVPRHRVGFYIPGYQQGVSPGLLRASTDGGAGDGTLGMDTDDDGYAAVWIVAGSSRDKARLNIVIDGGHNGNERISLPVQPKDGVETHGAVRLIKAGGDQQLVVIGGAFAALRVKALDGNTQPVPGARVRFSVSPGTGSVLAGDPAPAGADGVASAQLLAGRTPGPIAVTAQCGGAAPVIFNLTLAPKTASLELVAWPREASIVRGGSVFCYAQLRTRDSDPPQGWAYARGQVRAQDACLSLSPPGAERLSDADGMLLPPTQAVTSRDTSFGSCRVEFRVELDGKVLTDVVNLTVVAN